MAYHEANPTASIKEMAEATGAHHSYVTALLDREGAAYDRRMPFKAADLRAAIRRQPDIIPWLKKAKPREIDMGSFIVSILVDAMMEERDG